MSTQLFETLFLVNNIPEIAGILQVRDMIKSYALQGDWYMNEATKFGQRFKKVNQAIRRAYSRKNPITYYTYNYYNLINETNEKEQQQEWTFGFDSLNNRGVDNIKEHLQIHSASCYICGEYIQGYSQTISRLPYCNCPHNDDDEIPPLEDIDDLDHPINHDWHDDEYQQYWEDYWYHYNLDLYNTYNEDGYHDNDYYELNGYNNVLNIAFEAGNQGSPETPLP